MGILYFVREILQVTVLLDHPVAFFLRLLHMVKKISEIPILDGFFGKLSHWMTLFDHDQFL